MRALKGARHDRTTSTPSHLDHFPRPIGLGHVVFGLAGLLIWLHLLDATLVHPQANAGAVEHVVQATLAVVGPPLAFLA